MLEPMDNFIQAIKNWYDRNHEQTNNRIKGYLTGGNKRVQVEIEYTRSVNRLLYHYLEPYQPYFRELIHARFEPKNKLETLVILITNEEYVSVPSYLYRYWRYG